MASTSVATVVAPTVPVPASSSPLTDPDDLDPVGHEFIAKYRESLTLNGFKPNDINESALRRRRIMPTQGPRLVLIAGPNVPADNDHEQSQCFRDIVAARTISTYPLRADRSGTREGDPICDRYGFALYQNRAVIVVADGCNWGRGPMTAANRARDSVLSYLKEKDGRIRDVDEAGLYLLRSFNYAHRKMSERTTETEDIGTSTLLAGMVLELEPEPFDIPGKTNWAFVCASVGDCKAFHIDAETKQVSDVTATNRAFQSHSNDCGGRLGPTLADGGPDLRNLKTFFFPCKKDDIIIGMSDGIHDNLHPNMLGISPRLLGLEYEQWTDIPPEVDAEAMVVNFRVKYFAEQVLNMLEPTCRDIVNKSIQHALKITKSSKEWMESNPGKRLPKDYARFPGKMDHTTILCFRVGLVDMEPLDEQASQESRAAWSRANSEAVQPREPRIGAPGRRASMSLSPPIVQTTNVPLVVTLTKSPTGITIYCRATAKSKFECIAKRTEVILSITPSKLFELAPEEEIVGMVDELNQPFKRTISIPKELAIDIHSKRMAYQSELGIITIHFAYEARPPE